MQPESDMTFVMMRLKQYNLLQFSQGSVVLSEQEGGIQLIQSLDDALTKCQTLGMRLSRQRRSIFRAIVAGARASFGTANL